MAYISDVGKKEEGKKGTEFKHIRERWCLKNNHGARKRERGMKGSRKRRWRNEREGAERLVGVVDWGDKFLPSLLNGGRYRFSCNYFGITAAAAATMLRYRAAD